MAVISSAPFSLYLFFLLLILVADISEELYMCVSGY